MIDWFIEIQNSVINIFSIGIVVFIILIIIMFFLILNKIYNKFQKYLKEKNKNSTQEEEQKSKLNVQIAKGKGIAQASHGGTAIVNYYEQQKMKPPLQRPRMVENFTDREKELAKLLNDLQLGNVVTLCGPGGIGKSALASKAIWELAPGKKLPEKFSDGIVWHDFYTEPSVQIALESISRIYGEEPKPTPLSAAQRALAGKHVLVLLDGAEEADNLPLLLNVLGNCCVLVTTRKKNDAVSQRDDLQSLPTDYALELFQAWSQNTKDSKSAQQICELIGGLPLAVRLAGRYISVNGKSSRKFLKYLKKTPLEALNQGDRKLESVSILLKRSFIQVSDSALSILAIAGVLSFSSFNKDIIQSVLVFSIEKPITELIDYGLIDRSEKDRFILSHVLIHTYGRINQRPSKEIVEKIADYYISYAIEYDKQGHIGYSLLDKERVHILRILEECYNRNLLKRVIDLVSAISFEQSYLAKGGFWTERLMTLQLGIKASIKLKDRKNESFFMGCIGNTYIDLGQIEKAIDFFEKALSISIETGDSHGKNSWLGNLGAAYYPLGQVDKAINFYEQALAISNEIGDSHNEGCWLNNLASIYYDFNQVDKALVYFEKALAISEEIGDSQTESDRLSNLANIYGDLGQRKKAISYYEKALSISRKIGDRRGEGSRLGNMGTVYSDLGLIEKALNNYEQALAISREIGDRQNEGRWLGNIGNAYMNLGQIKKAINCYEQALSIDREIGRRKGEELRLGNMGNAYRQLGQTEKAINYYQQALTISREILDKRGEICWLENIGHAYCELKQFHKGIQFLSLSDKLKGVQKRPWERAV